MASSANREHEGSKRQFSPSIGDTTHRYARSAATNGKASKCPAANVQHTTSEREWLTQLGDQLRIGEFGRAGLGDDDEVAGRWQIAAVKAHELPKTSLHSVAHHRVAHAAAYAETKASRSGGWLLEVHDEKVGALLGFAASLHP